MSQENRTTNKVVMPTDISLLDRYRPRKVVFYGRVSTEHEAQLSALENQMQWYEKQAEAHSNWTILRKFIDEGITGTQAKKRPAFMEMLEHAKKGEFDLVVTRDVCRFARNTVDALMVTRQLKEYGVEVYFVQDDIWTMAGEGELRLSLMATFAQEESRKTSERVRAGQKISRDNGVLYGNGNILGYDRDKNTGTYVINKEQAETVRIIYDLYSRGYGYQRIVNELVRMKRKDSSGLVRWECTKISRILHNATYKGYQGYLKSYRNNFLDQRCIINRDESTYLYVKGKYEPIISEELWDRCKQIRERKLVPRERRDGKNLLIGGGRTSNDLYAKKMLCSCGYRFRKDKWHTTKMGISYGYKCYNQLNNGSKQARKDAGLPYEQFCDMGTIADWKLDMMIWYILKDFDIPKDKIISAATGILNECMEESPQEKEEELRDLDVKLIKERSKLGNLTEMRLGGEISKDEYIALRRQIEMQIEVFEKRKTELTAKPLVLCEGESACLTTITQDLKEKINFDNPMIDRDIIEMFVTKIVPSSGTEFNWYMNFIPRVGDDIDTHQELYSFTINFSDAKAFRKMRHGLLRPTQWKDITVHLYV